MSESGIRVSVIVVAEGPVPLDELYAEYSAPLRSEGIRYEFVFVSSADRGALLQSLLPMQNGVEPIQLLETAHSVGEAALVRSALPLCSGGTLVMLSADRRVAAEAIPALVRDIEAGADLVVARRSENGDPFVSRLQRRLAHRFIRRLVGGSFHDLGSGVRAIRRDVLADLPLYGEFSRFLPLFAARDGFVVEERLVPTHASARSHRLYSPGIYIRRLNDLLAVYFLIRFREKPLRFFGLIGAVIGLGGLLVLGILGIQRLQGVPLADRPMLVVGVLLVVLGVQSVSLGLIGEIIVHASAKRRTIYRLAPPRAR